MKPSQTMKKVEDIHKANVKSLKKQGKEIERVIQDTKEVIESTSKMVEIAKRYEKVPPKNKEELKELMTLLCFENLSFCCKKPCPLRNAVLKCLNITPEDFERDKEEWGYKKYGRGK